MWKCENCFEPAGIEFSHFHITKKQLPPCGGNCAEVNRDWSLFATRAPGVVWEERLFWGYDEG